MTYVPQSNYFSSTSETFTTTSTGSTVDISQTPMRNWTLLVTGVVGSPAPTVSIIHDGAPSGSWVQVADSSSLDIVSSFSMSVWLKIPSGLGVESIVMEKSNGGTNYYLYTSNLGGGNTGLLFGIGAPPERLTGIFPINNSAWRHVVAVFDAIAGTLTLYVDGIFSESVGGVSNTLVANTSPLTMAARALGYYPLTGNMANVRLYARVLSPAEIIVLKNGGELSTVNLAGKWLVDEGIGTAIADTSGNSNDATIVGANITWETAVPTDPIWEVILEGSINAGVTFSEIFKHNASVGLNENLFSGTTLFPATHYRTRCTALTLNSYTSITANVLGQQ